ncbi:MAG: nitroreductase family protein [Rubrivivax sp.]|nr:nitroreductase family protein [Rubrivivax sp.]
MLSNQLPPTPQPPPDQTTQVVREILQLARWAPSGDNTQPWHFSIVSPMHAVIHAYDTREHCVYDIDGQPSQISLGCLVETAVVAATAHGLRTNVVLRQDAPDTHPVVDLHFEHDANLRRDPLVDAIERRSVQRRPYETTPLKATDKAELEACVGPGHRVHWLEGRASRRSAALLMFQSARLRMVTPEAYRVHSEVIEWNARYSADKVPDQSLGVSAAMLSLMRFAMQSWGRVQFFNRFLAGTWLPRLQMDLLPALACAGHFVLLADEPADTLEGQIRAGRAVQRFWLTATHLGLMLQPELTPLIFARYATKNRPFSIRHKALEEARGVAVKLARVFGPQALEQGVFMGRIGYAPAPSARSLRRDLAQLLAG